MKSKNIHKDVLGLVKEIYHDWEWGKEEQFAQDLKTKTAEDFAIQFHNNIGMQIRNSYGLWKGDTDLHEYFLSIGIKHPDEMSHKVFLELYKYGREKLGI